MTGQRIGYRRVSTIDQNTARQLDGLSVDKAFEDKASGKDTARPQLQAALDFCREGDTLVVHSMDRLARNLTDLRLLVKRLTDVACPHFPHTNNTQPAAAVAVGVCMVRRRIASQISVVGGLVCSNVSGLFVEPSSWP